MTTPVVAAGIPNRLSSGVNVMRDPGSYSAFGQTSEFMMGHRSANVQYNPGQQREHPFTMGNLQYHDMLQYGKESTGRAMQHSPENNNPVVIELDNSSVEETEIANIMKNTSSAAGFDIRPPTTVTAKVNVPSLESNDTFLFPNVVKHPKAMESNFSSAASMESMMSIDNRPSSAASVHSAFASTKRNTPKPPCQVVPTPLLVTRPEHVVNKKGKQIY